MQSFLSARRLGRALSALLLFTPVSAVADSVSMSTDFGMVSLEIEPDGHVWGDYPDYKGDLVGSLKGDGVLDMVWVQPNSVSLVMRQYAESPLRSTIPVAVHHSTNAPPLPRTPSPYISRVSMVPCGGVRQNSLGTLPQAAMPMVTMPMGVMPATGYTCTEWSFGNPRFPQ